MPQTTETATSISTRGDLRPISPTDIRVSEGTIPNIKEVERIVQVLKNKGSLPEIIITSDNVLIHGIDALEAARQVGQALILASVQKLKIESSKIRLADIKLDGGTQSRAGINQQVIDEYSVAWRDGAKFPPVILFYDGENYWLADGFHRCISAKQAGLAEIEADIRQGTRRDAVLFSVGANSNHGLRRTNEDKRRAVITLLNDEEWCQWSDREIARRTGTHHDTVGRIRAELSGGFRQIEERKVERNGTTYAQKPKKDKPWLPKETEEVEIVGGEFKGKRAEVRVVSGNMAMCFIDGGGEHKNIRLSDMKPLAQEEQKPVTTVEQEVKQKQKELGLGVRSQIFPEVDRNEGFDPEEQPNLIVSSSEDVAVTEAAIALSRLTPEQVNQALRTASLNWSKAHVEAAYQALHEYARTAA